MQEKQITCHSCQEDWAFLPPLGRRDECPGCGRDAKVCLNCRYYDPSAHHECRETEAEWVKEKDKGNFCGYFESKASGAGSLSEAEKARLKLAAMFGEVANEKKSATLDDELAKFMAGKKKPI